MRPSRLRPLLLLLGALIAARVLFILLMPGVYSRDLFSWLRVMEVLDAGGNPYEQTEVLNWPPFWMQILFGIHQVAKRTGLDDIRLIQGTLIACEALVLSVAYFVGRDYFPGKRLFRVLLLGLALNPASIFLSCQHCNYDVFVGLWVLLAAWMLMEWTNNQKPDAWLMACFFIGMGILAKTVPAILTPLLLIGFRQLSLRTKVFGAMLLAAPFAIGMGVLFTLEPHGVMHNVIGYRSLGGWYGFTGVLWLLRATDALAFYKSLSPFLFIGLMLFTAWKSYHAEAVQPALKVIIAVLLLILFIPTFGPGYSPPYLLWYLPLAVLVSAASGKGVQRLMLVGWGIITLTYIVEYAILGSHGAYLARLYPTPRILYLAENFGGRDDQTLIRLPLFGFYLVLFAVLLRRLRSGDIQLRASDSSDGNV